jgi:hypothetical protein
MSHALHVSDEFYEAIEAIAAKKGERPEALAEAWLKERATEEQDEATPYSAAWLQGLDAALAQIAAGQGRRVDSADELLRLITGDAPTPPKDHTSDANL